VNHIGETFYLETLGCPRNEADSEAIINILTASGFKLVEIPEKADIIIVNGCAFISDAVEESIDCVLSLRNKNRRATLIIVGCLAQRYGQDLIKILDEVDLFVGTGSIKKISEIIAKGKSEVNSNYGFLDVNLYKEPHVTPEHYRYIKIQEGCNYKCSYCIIPKLKGFSHSKELKNINEEISNLPDKVKEIILIGQNTTSWGKDLSDNGDLCDVIKGISPLFQGWIRFLYFHPLSVTRGLLKTMKDFPNVLNYLDIPLQHVSESVLKDMNRGYGRKKIENLLELIESVEDFTLRTTFIVGFPTETNKDFEDLCSFIEGKNIDHIGVFGYYHEEGSASFSLSGLPNKVVKRRLEIISSLIEEKTIKRNKKLIGKSVNVLVDGIEEGEYYGRTKTSAPDIDPVAWISTHDKNLNIGEIYSCLITDTLGCDIGCETTPVNQAE
jgi:ribosomal protein S12 methylthiotransferase